MDPFDFDFSNNSNTRGSENEWFNDFRDTPAAKPSKSDDFFGFDDEPPSKPSKPRAARAEQHRDTAHKSQSKVSYFDQFDFDAPKPQPKQKQKIDDFVFGSQKDSESEDESHEDNEDIIGFQTHKKHKHAQDPPFEDEDQHQDLLFGDEGKQNLMSGMDADDDLLFGDGKVSKDTDLLFGEQSRGNYGDKDDEEDDGFSPLFDLDSDNSRKKAGNNNDLIYKLTSLYSESGLPTGKTRTSSDEVLQPQLPKVMQEHEEKQKKFVPEVQSLGETFWDNHQSKDDPFANVFSFNSAAPQPSYYQAPPKNISSPQKSQKPSGPAGFSMGSKPLVTKKQQKEGNFKNLGIDYLLQTNIKRS